MSRWDPEGPFASQMFNKYSSESFHGTKNSSVNDNWSLVIYFDRKLLPHKFFFVKVILWINFTLQLGSFFFSQMFGAMKMMPMMMRMGWAALALVVWVLLFLFCTFFLFLLILVCLCFFSKLFLTFLSSLTFFGSFTNVIRRDFLVLISLIL